MGLFDVRAKRPACGAVMPLPSRLGMTPFNKCMRENVS